MISAKQTNNFKFKQFTIKQDLCTMKVNTDGVLLGAWAEVCQNDRVLDIGTGTGVIALMIAQKASNCTVIGIDIDKDSCLEAKENVENSIFANQVSIEQISIQEYAENNKISFDHIVSNPPFFSGGTFSANENKANVRHTIKLPHGDLLKSVNSLLDTEGQFSLILPFIEGLRFQELAERSGLFLNKKTSVRHHESKPIERLLLGFSKTKSKLIENEIYLTEGIEKTFTQDYINLTKDFYQNF
jgi:tRNA1Val (adenine37-N6)-methyltransferase